LELIFMDEKLCMRGAFLSADDTSRVITFRASSAAVDRHGTRIDPTGIDTDNYNQNPVFCWAHDAYPSMFGVPKMEHVLGRVVATRASNDAFDIDVEFATADVNPLADQALKMVKARFLNAVSIGFRIIDAHVSVVDGEEIPMITKCELLEISLVAVPSNPEALALSRAKEKTKSSVPPVERQQSSTPPSQEADFGVVIHALQRAFTDWQIQKAFESALN
jgi:HK97 family phage prohead protease